MVSPTAKKKLSKKTVASPAKTAEPSKKAAKPRSKAVAAKAKTQPSAAQVAVKAKTKAKAKASKLPKPADPKSIVERLLLAIRKPECELSFKTPFELLTATILAAQSTDKTVNQVMPVLLARYPTAEALAQSSQEDVEALVKRTGFFRNKAKAIRGMAQHLVAEHGGQVPRTIEEMVELPGVARKTANVVLGTAYGISSGFVVDTHVTRVAQRLALSRHTDPVRIEQDLCAIFPATEWVDTGHRLILHGRYTCLAKRPQCEDCPINELCPSRQALVVDSWQKRAEREDVRTNAGLLASRGH
ncbi:MAG: endonuclease [Myxococcaceae bacterium]|nr:endonuclease [Myxococcaceae bacterium]